MRELALVNACLAVIDGQNNGQAYPKPKAPGPRTIITWGHRGTYLWENI